MTDSDGEVTIADVEAMHDSGKALLCVIYDEEVWIPKSEILPDSDVQKLGDKGFLVIKSWIAREKDLD